jgi:hypothetical protein
MVPILMGIEADAQLHMPQRLILMLLATLWGLMLARGLSNFLALDVWLKMSGIEQPVRCQTGLRVDTPESCPPLK